VDVLEVLPVEVPGVIPAEVVVDPPVVVPVLAGVVVVVPVVVVVLVPPLVVDGVLLIVEVCVEPLAIVVVALADVRLPDESIEYWAVPVPPPHAESSAATLAVAINEAGRKNFRRVDTLDINISPSHFLDPLKSGSIANACVRALLEIKSSFLKSNFRKEFMRFY
jgi:hypothetical protein